MNISVCGTVRRALVLWLSFDGINTLLIFLTHPYPPCKIGPAKFTARGRAPKKFSEEIFQCTVYPVYNLGKRG